MKSAATLLFALLLAPVLDHGPAYPQVRAEDEIKALRLEIEFLKQEQGELRKELEKIKELLKERLARPTSAPREVFVSIDDDPVKGDPKAKITLIEFSDYECPFCARHFRDTLPQLERDYIRTGKVKYVFRDFPIESIHKQAFKAAEAANCAGEQRRYWEMHDRLFANQKALGRKDLSLHAQQIELSLASFERCLDSGKYAAEIRKDLADGKRAGVKGTPSFFIGLTQPDDSTIKALKIIRGASPYSGFKEAIESLLSTQSD